MLARLRTNWLLVGAAVSVAAMPPRTPPTPVIPPPRTDDAPRTNRVTKDRLDAYCRSVAHQDFFMW